MTDREEELRFQALLLEKDGDGAVRSGIRTVTERELPAGDVLIRVAYSSMNYKDAMAVGMSERIVRGYPMVPGIDLAGTVVRSGSPLFRPGDDAVLTGWHAGERKWGGYAQYARMPAEQLIPLPPGLSLRHAMTIGTAGLTAMLCVAALERHGVRPEQGDVIVTGATGGVGSFAIMLLSAAGFRVTAVSGKPDQADYLRRLGAGEVIGRDELTGLPNKPLNSERWAGAVDTVGGAPLSAIISSVKYGGAIAACGMAASPELHASVYPFILRNVALLGVESVVCPTDRRAEAWERLSRQLPKERLEEMTRIVALRDVEEEAKRMLAGGAVGRIVVDVNR